MYSSFLLVLEPVDPVQPSLTYGISIISADKDEVEGSIQLRFDTESAAQTFANELQAGDVLAPGLHMDFDSDQVMSTSTV